MGKYCIATYVNGNYSVKAEYGSLDSARVGYFSTCSAFWNAPDVIEATVAILDSNLRVVGQYSEYIHHETTTDGSGDGE